MKYIVISTTLSDEEIKELQENYPLPHEYVELFTRRQKMHENKVKENAQRLADTFPEISEKLLLDVKTHDKSKWEGLEYYGYVWLTLFRTYHKMYPNGKFFYLENMVRNGHYNNNQHHPEYWIHNSTLANMPDYQLAHMVADWGAMSYECHTSLVSWWVNRASKKYQFNNIQKEKIKQYISIFTELHRR